VNRNIVHIKMGLGAVVIVLVLVLVGVGYMKYKSMSSSWQPLTVAMRYSVPPASVGKSGLSFAYNPTSPARVNLGVVITTPPDGKGSMGGMKEYDIPVTPGPVAQTVPWSFGGTSGVALVGAVATPSGGVIQSLRMRLGV
jgi:hypothetical protein